MRTFIADIIPKIQRYSQKLDNLILLTNQHWVLIENIEQEKHVYLFRPNNELLISKNGKITKGKWEDLGNRSLLIEQGDQAFLFKHAFIDENLLALKTDSKDEYALFVNENKYDGDINSLAKLIDFMTNHYLHSENRRQIENQTGIKIVQEGGQLKPDEIKQDSTMRGIFWVYISIIAIVIILIIWGRFS